MSSKELARFCLEYLPKHPDLKKTIDASPDKQQFVSAMRAVGSKAGFEFTEVDVEEGMVAVAMRSTELTDDQLQAVAGGVRKAGKGQQEYMTYELKDVLITSYQSGES